MRRMRPPLPQRPDLRRVFKAQEVPGGSRGPSKRRLGGKNVEEAQEVPELPEEYRKEWSVRLRVMHTTWDEALLQSSRDLLDGNAIGLGEGCMYAAPGASDPHGMSPAHLMPRGGISQQDSLMTRTKSEDDRQGHDCRITLREVCALACLIIDSMLREIRTLHHKRRHAFPYDVDVLQLRALLLLLSFPIPYQPSQDLPARALGHFIDELHTTTQLLVV